MGWFSRKPKDPDQPAPPRKPYWITQIRKDALDMVFASAKSQHPHEFGALLRAEKGVITEILILPGTLSGGTTAIFQLHMLPIDFSVKGTVHSHPTPNAHPSQADRELFAKFGSTHIIAGYPYTDRSWRAYNSRGEEIALRVVE